MHTAILTLKSATLSLVMGTLMLVNTSTARTLQGHDHGGHGGHEGASEQTTKKAEVAGDAYTLGTDPVTGKPLGSIDKQVVMQHEGRELRFSSDKTAAKFMKDPAKYLKAVDKQMIAQQLPFYPLQKCIVSGEELGGEMGDPVDVIYKNRLVRLCCNGCKRKLEKDPASLIAQLDKAVIAAQSKDYPLTTCPITGEELGGMGKPVNYVVGNRLVKLCCAGCMKKVKKDPAGALAKLDAVIKKQGKHEKGGKHHDDDDDDHGGKGHDGGHGDGHGDHDH